MFFELREYRCPNGQRDNWVKFMEEEIIPLIEKKENTEFRVMLLGG